MDPTHSDQAPNPEQGSFTLPRLEFVPPPEAPPIEYASLERRAKAVAIDAGLALVLVLVLAALGGGPLLSRSFGLALTGVPFLVATVAWFIYMTLMEGLTGASVGKRIMKLRVDSVDGSPIDLEAALIRNALRILDGFPYIVPYLVGARVARRSPMFQRLGDVVAETVVVVDQAPAP